MQRSAHGFTLVELLVVIAVMAIIGAYTLSNYRTFGEDQNLKNAALDVQSLLRLAQSNSTSGLKCQDQGTLGWLVEIISNQNMYLKCKNSSSPIPLLMKTLSFPTGISIFGISSGMCRPTVFAFAPLYGSVTASCDPGPSLTLPITITLRNSKTNNTQTITIEQGGRIYVQ